MTQKRIEQRDLYYERMAASSDWDAATNPYETQIRLRLFQERVFPEIELAGKTFLDGGSGGGHFSAMAEALGARVVSIDMGLSLLKQVGQRCGSRKAVASILSLPWRDGTFDVAFSTEVIEHTPDPYQALGELARVVRPGGRVIVTSPGRLWQPVVRAASALGLRAYQGRENFLWPRRAASRLESAGVRIDDVFGFNLLPAFRPMFFPILRGLDHMGRALPFLYVNWAVVGTRT